MKNTIKRLSSLVLVMALVLGMAVSASAAPSNGKITVTAPSTGMPLLSGDIKAYRIFALTYDGTDAYSYTLTSKFAGLPAAFNTKYPGRLSTVDGNGLLAYLGGDENDESVKAYEFGELVRTFITTNSTAHDYSQSGNGKNKVEFNVGQNLGYYIVLGSADYGQGLKIIGTCALVSTDYEAEIILKANLPTIKKTVHHVPKIPTAGVELPDQWGRWADAEIGSDVEFRLESKVPNMNGYTSYTFKMHDTMDASLTFIPSSVTVKLNGTDLVNNVDYKIHTSGGGLRAGATFTVEFLNMINRKAQVDQPIVVEYKATLNENALISEKDTARPNSNKVFLEFSNNPSTNGTGDTVEVIVDVFTYAFKIYKYTDPTGSNKQPLADAEFSVYKDAACTIPYYFKPTGTAGEYKVTKSTTSGATTTIVSPASGIISLIGFDAGIYYIKETKAPDGYNLLTAADGSDLIIDMSLAAFIDDGYVTKVKANLPGESKTDVSKWTVTYAGAIYTVEVENKSGVKLPETGGIGTTIFTTSGVGIMLAAAILFERKKEVEVKVKNK